MAPEASSPFNQPSAEIAAVFSHLPSNVDIENSRARGTDAILGAGLVICALGCFAAAAFIAVACKVPSDLLGTAFCAFFVLMGLFSLSVLLENPIKRLFARMG